MQEKIKSTLSRRTMLSGALAVPLTALSEDSTGTYVRRRMAGNGGGSDPTHRVSVRVLSQQDGWALVASNDLRDGDQIAIIS